MKTKTAPTANTKASSSPQQKLAAGRKALCAALVERDDEVDLVLTALIAGEHPLLVGAPGTAKSLLCDSLVRWMGPAAKSFSMLFNKFSTPEEVFGPVSVTGLKADVFRRVTTGKLPEAEVAFADEIFKASSAILNTMLRLLNERVYDNGTGSFAKCPLRICVAASNEWPGDNDGGKELCALLDRFLFRKTVKNISPRNGRKELLRRAISNDPCQAAFPEALTASDLDTAHQEAKDLPWTDAAKKALWEILEALDKEGIRPGDRRQYKSILAARAYAYLCGSDEVRPEHLEILAHTLWDDPQEQPEKTAKIVARIANPTGAKVTELLIQAEDVLTNAHPNEAVPKLQAIQKELAGMPDEARVEKARGVVAANIKAAYDKVLGLDRGE